VRCLTALLFAKIVRVMSEVEGGERITSGMIVIGESRGSRKETCPGATWSITLPHWLGLE
jgi:hypothetical protein